ncbi:hypothetical protein H2203_007921 [Taxawa tesnikishii (nom. ined.)]|nr:hypothetical protein H2203_007921 [Dothideales sp. JES 119]
MKEEQAMSLTTSSLFDVSGLVAVITGGATGIGLMMTRALAANGAAKVFIVGRRREKLESAASEYPDIVVPVVGDVTSKESLKQVAEKVKAEAGFVNLLVCNSGVMGPRVDVKPGEVSVAEYAQKAFDIDYNETVDTFAVNTASVMYTSYAFLELLDAGNQKKNRVGIKSQILITSSIASFSRLPGLSMAYNASKAATTHFTKHLSSTLVPYSIRVNAIAPGLFPSELAAGLISHAKMEPDQEGAFDKSFIPAERTGSETDMGVPYCIWRARQAHTSMA